MVRPLSKRKLKKFAKADEICRELRHIIELPINGTQENWTRVFHQLIKWMQLSGKEKYERPKWAKKQVK